MMPDEHTEGIVKGQLGPAKIKWLDGPTKVRKTRKGNGPTNASTIRKCLHSDKCSIYPRKIMVGLTYRTHKRQNMHARMQQFTAGRLLRSARPSVHSSKLTETNLAIDEMNDDDYARGRDTPAEAPEARLARVFALRVNDMAQELVYLGDDIYDAIQRSIADLEMLPASPGTSGAVSPAISQSVAARMAVLANVKVTRSQTEEQRASLRELCHFYRALVRHTAGAPNDVAPAQHALQLQTFMFSYQCVAVRKLAQELYRDVRDPALDAIPGLVTRLLRERASSLAGDMYHATKYLTASSTRLYNLKLAEAGGEALGHLHGFLFWKSCQFEDRLSDLHRLRLRQEAEPLFPLSTQYSESTTDILWDIDTMVWNIYDELRSIESWFKALRRQIYHNASMSGRSGALEPFAITIRKQLVKFCEEQYRREAKGPWRFLRRWGYRPSRWYRRIQSGRSVARPQDVSWQSVRRKHRSERQKYIRKLASPLHVRYYVTNSVWAKTRTYKLKSIRNVRKQLRDRRKTALGKMRRMLSATLLSYQSRTFKSMRSADRLASLPKKEKPSSITQVGMTIAALGFYEKADGEINNIKTNYSRKVEPLTGKSGSPLIRWKGTQGKPIRVLPQFKARFRATQSMRAPHPTSIFFSSDAWEYSIDVPTDPDASGRTSLVSECSASSPGCRTSGDNPDTEYPRTDSTGERRPEHPLDGRNNQPPNEKMDKVPKNDPPSDSEHEDESKSEVDEDSDTEEPEEEHTPLTYQIPPDVLYNALQAPPQTRGSYWSQKLYRGPEDKELLLHYCVNMEVSERVAKHFLNEKVVGFDIEWKPFGSVDSIKENASLIQLATEDRIALFHIARFPGKTPEQLMPPTLKVVLETAETLKVGVAVKNDCNKLEKYFGLNMHGVFELSRLHNLVEYYKTAPSKVNNKLVKLATQVHQHLLLPLHKGEPFIDEMQRSGSVRESDWSRPLDHEQIHYAAADAYAGFRLFDVLESKRKKLKPTPPIRGLCDYDNKPVPRTTPKAKIMKKAAPDMEKIVAESLSGLEADDAEEEAYETAAEELAEQEADEDADSEFASESSEAEDPNADYKPNVRGRLALGPRLSDASAASKVPIGRVDISRLNDLNPRYPKLPILSATEEATSEESDAFDTPPKGPRRRRVARPAQEAEVLAAGAEESEDEFPDPELDEAFASMDLDEPSKNASNPATGAAPEADAATSTTNIDPPQVEEEPPEPYSSTIAPTPTFTPLIQPDSKTHTPEFTLATTWAQNYLASTIPSPSSPISPRIRATVPPLRAYHLWYHQRVPLDAIGAHLRDPPLAQATVGSYIVQAINMEKLEYRDADLITLMGTLPANLRLGRYGWLSRKLGIVR
ncbi:hypothetical protein SLS60_009545 [Paraconiothyrium brasiliense]|uniref:3'-5' exonuclease domain-containing protein n=1 Tax=Paraconiothyrium brasiliense TaxID=300254 RepID=A0ABR3QUK6_9PLEO